MTETANAVDVEAVAAEWLEKRTHGEWTEADQLQFDGWLQTSLANRIAYLRLEDAWRFADRLSALKPVRPDAGDARASRFKFARNAIAACLVIGAGLLAARFYMATPAEKTYATSIGDSKRLTLADGTQIELNTDTLVRIDRDGNTRKVWLDKGEAYFQVKHDPAHPFVVIADGHRLLDIGTKFLVRRDRGKLHVSVLEGKVQYDPQINSHTPILLASGDVLTATKNSVSVNRAGTTEIANALGWRSGVITLDNTTLADAISEFNRYSRRHVVIADPEVAHLRIMGTFQAGNADAFVAVAQDIFKLHVKRNRDEIVISR
jgi:transmembrane sensor